ncbi:MAG: hypothetical protein HYV27_05000 [Candidatus Hydrogenedentes bacterium]|nr:hypothetical protein [Candidatus Hydrogenedentota bacterium]
MKEVVDISAGQIEAAPSFGTAVDTAFILAMGKVGGRVVILPNADKVLTIGELNHLEGSLVST